MPLLSRSHARPLLKTVAGVPHAGKDDHEEEVDIMADPISSDDDAVAVVSAMASREHPQAKSTIAARSRTRSTSATTLSRTRRKEDNSRLRVPSKGTHGKGKELRRGLSFNGSGNEKENEDVRGVFAASDESAHGRNKRKTEDPLNFGMEYRSSAKIRRVSKGKTYGSAKVQAQEPGNTSCTTLQNIHAKPAVIESRTYGTKRAKGSLLVYAPKIPSPGEAELDSDEMSKLDHDLDACLAELENKQEASSKRNLMGSLAAYSRPESSPLDPDATHLPERPSSTDQRGLYDSLRLMEQDVAALPTDDANASCHLCEASVELSHAQAFWSLHTKTVRNQTLFCKEHRKRAALEQYKERGYPDIEWPALPRRIARLRPQLVRLLKNEVKEESIFRTRHTAALVSGRAAVLKASRPHQDCENLDPPPPREASLSSAGANVASSSSSTVSSAIPSTDTITGYYGPRGHRVMMDALTSLLSAELRDVAASDPLVGRSGFAVYMQKVLVPELTVLLVQQDLGLVRRGRKGELEAQRVMEESGEIGALVWEEGEDEVVIDEDEDEDKDGDEDHGSAGHSDAEGSDR